VNRWIVAGLLLALALGAALRLPRLEERPLHTDESVHAYKFAGLWDRGEYRYDPDEYHGPSLYYATLPFAWLSGAANSDELREATLRLVPLFFGLALILLVVLMADALGPPGAVTAGLLTAVSTAFAFYSRYYIHEMLLVFFAGLLGAALWRYTRRPAWGWAALAGVALGLMHATKETFVLNLAAMAVAGVAVLALDPDRHEAWLRLRASGRPGHLALAAGVALAVSVTFFTSFFQHAGGPLDSLRTYLPWLQRAGGASPHLHPWTFYLERLFWFRPAAGPVFSELLIGILALVGAAAAFLPDRFPPFHRGLARFLTIYTVVLIGLYSVIGYKTPWCVLGFLHGLILLAGVGVAALFRWARLPWLRGVLAALLLAAAAQLATQARRANGAFSTDQRNPWVYAHTSKDLLRLVDRVLGVARTHGDPARMEINVLATGGDYWPLPWYLRSLKETRWADGIPADPFAPVVIASARLHASLDEKSDKRWISAGYYEHRPRVFLELFVELELWKRYLASLPPPRDDEEDVADNRR
jgi:uncharacterized protein (TIGR03663 family)